MKNKLLKFMNQSRTQDKS